MTGVQTCALPIVLGQRCGIELCERWCEKRVTLDVENVHAKCHITVVLQDKTWDLYRVESRDMLGGAFGCFPCEGGYVGAVDE